MELSKYSDFLKMAMYHNCGGERHVVVAKLRGAKVLQDSIPVELGRILV